MATDSIHILNAVPTAAPQHRANVALFITNNEGHILMGRRSGTSSWQAPQGGVDAGESLRQAALRELWEETGLPVEAVTLCGAAPQPVSYTTPTPLVKEGRVYIGQTQWWVWLETELLPNAATAPEKEFTEFCWRQPQDFLEGVIPFKRPSYTYAAAYFLPLVEKRLGS